MTWHGTAHTPEPGTLQQATATRSLLINSINNKSAPQLPWHFWMDSQHAALLAGGPGNHDWQESQQPRRWPWVGRYLC